MKKILITEFMNQNSIRYLKKKFNVVYNKNFWKNKKKLENIISNFDAIIVRNKTQVNESLLKQTNNLKFIGRLGVGLDNINTKYCKKRRIHVQPATGMNADSVAEYVIGSSLYLIKNISLLHDGTTNGLWPRTLLNSREIKGKIFGLLGFGTIGKKVCKLAKNFGAEVVSFDPYINKSIQKKFNIKLLSFKKLIKISDIISIHLPLNDKTKNLIKYSTFTLMKKKPIIINSSRGSIVNENDLIRAYKKKLISGFALDVFNQEPVSKIFYKKIDKSINCIITPHIAGVTDESNIRVSDFIVKKLIKFFR
jgi:phosphoglycerate dehydrogenase-like enzyme|tara:strand:- start:3060 stop:3983 length:924 start_codon:yes stop_codon:yes gene_type:complete